jgi:hypothetical protein
VTDDTTPPTIDLASPPDDAVFAQGERVTVSYSCEDEPGGSGIASCTGNLPDGAALPTSKPGEYGFSVQAEDNAGNKTSVIHSFTVVADTTPPAIALTVPADGASYTEGDEPTAEYTCDDGPDGTGVASCVGDVADGGRLDTSPGDHTFTVTATDKAGNRSEVTHRYHVASDTTKPTVTLTVPALGAVFTQDQDVPASFVCQDEPGGSDIASCDGTVDNGDFVDTSAVGTFPFAVVATDNAGNQQTVVHYYTVKKQVSSKLADGGTLSTDPSGSGPSTDNPVQAAVTSPGGGTVAITVGPAATGSTPSGFTAAGMEVDITAPPAANPAHPLVIVFELSPAQLPAGATAATLQVFKNGLQVPACTGPAGTASPDPCITARDTLPGGGARITVLTTTASHWQFAQHLTTPAHTPVPTLYTLSPPSGTPGTLVTIHGLHLTNTSQVTFNGVPAAFTQVSDTIVTATVPPLATTGKIALTTPGGTAHTATTFTVIPPVPPQPTITSFSPSSGIKGVTVIIRGTGLTGTTTVTFDGKPTAFTVENDTTIKAIVPADATTGPITITTPGGTATSSTTFTVP